MEEFETKRKEDILEIDNETSKKTDTLSSTTDNKILPILGLLNILTIFTGVIGLVGIIGLYIVKKDELTEKEETAIKENLNFQISFFIYLFISAILTVILVGLLGIVVFGIAYLIGLIIGAIKYFNNESYDYFWTIKFLK